MTQEDLNRISDALNAPIDEAIGVAIGMATVCWAETPAGVFDSTRAATIAGLLSRRVQKEINSAKQQEQHG